VDTFPGKIFHGYVQSISGATGAATALLPPDNATGNFTKVVQRIPVRIELYPASSDEDSKYARVADIERLRQGMSVTATIDSSDNSGSVYKKHLQANNGKPIAGQQAAENGYGTGTANTGGTAASGQSNSGNSGGTTDSGGMSNAAGASGVAGSTSPAGGGSTGSAAGGNGGASGGNGSTSSGGS
jgi:hypothetical protein